MLKSPTLKKHSKNKLNNLNNASTATALRAWAEPGEGLRSWYRSEQLNEPVSVHCWRTT